jgi:hypothetical protein
MTDNPSQIPRAHQIELPPEHVVGVPADFASVWHTPESFVIDFLAARGPAQVADHEGEPVVVQDTETGRRAPVDPELPGI